MVEPRILCSNVKLYIWTSELINLKHYSQTCPNNHLCKTRNAESAQANSGLIVTVQDEHLPNATSNYFFGLQNEKLSKTTTTKLYPAKECGKNIRNNA